MKHLWRATGLVMGLVAVRAFACGPDFPEVLLDDRMATLAGLPEGVFSWDAMRLVAAPGAFVPADRADGEYTESPPTRDKVERGILGAEFARGAAIRERVTAAVAYAAGEGLPEEARRYLAGAAAFSHGRLAEAAQRFASVLELPAGECTHYSVWAVYMLGRSVADTDVNAASAAFQHVRSLVSAGAVDTLGLAADSYGEEARLHLTAGDDNAAIALYAQQAALQSRFGAASLLQVARAIVRDPKRLERAIGDPLAQRLVTTYLATRGSELDASQFTDDSDPDTSAATAERKFRPADREHPLRRRCAHRGPRRRCRSARRARLSQRPLRSRDEVRLPRRRCDVGLGPCNTRAAFGQWRGGSSSLRAGGEGVPGCRGRRPEESR